MFTLETMSLVQFENLPPNSIMGVFQAKTPRFPLTLCSTVKFIYIFAWVLGSEGSLGYLWARWRGDLVELKSTACVFLVGNVHMTGREGSCIKTRSSSLRRRKQEGLWTPHQHFLFLLKGGSTPMESSSFFLRNASPVYSISPRVHPLWCSALLRHMSAHTQVNLLMYAHALSYSLL